MMNELPGSEFACVCADLGARLHLQSQGEEWARQHLCGSYISRRLEGFSAFSLSPWLDLNQILQQVEGKRLRLLLWSAAMYRPQLHKRWQHKGAQTGS